MTSTANKMEFYYGNEAEQFVFYRVPKILFKDKRFSIISSDAKLLYSLFLDRISLSKKNAWIDEEKRVYIYFSIEEIQEEFGVASQKATKMIAELDDIKGCGLIHRKKQGQGKYNNTEINNTDFNDINPILSHQEKRENDIEERNRYEEIIRDNIDYDILVQNNPDVDIGGMVGIMLDAICSKRDYLNINSDSLPKEVVKSRLLKLDSEHINYVIECLKKNTTKVGNIKSYLLTALYNSYTTQDHYYRAEVNHDLYG